MEFLCRLFCNHIHWYSKKVFFDNVRDKHLIKLLSCKGIIVVDSPHSADFIIVRHHRSCWWSYKEITLHDLYFYLSDNDKHLYYISRLKKQHRPTQEEKVYFVHHYMVVINSSQKTFHIFRRKRIPFIDQRIYTKTVVSHQPYTHAWVDDKHTFGKHTDSMILRMPIDRYMTIGNAVCLFEQDPSIVSSSSFKTASTPPFLLHRKPNNLAQYFQKQPHVWCRVLHHE